ncbi:MAG: glycoside hydrolase family 26 protein [Streptosporangiaceae bacterium]
MKYRLVTLIGFVIAVTAIAVTSSRITFRYPPAVHETLAPRTASYLGVFEAGTPPGTPPRYRSVEQFSDMARQQPNLVGYYSGWAQPFNVSYARMLHGHGAIPFVQIDPSFASVPAIAVGDYDTYLRSYADSVRDYGHAVVIGFGHEMNGDWYSWGYGSTSPKAFVAAWQHIVTVFRQEGAFNVTWLWTVNQEERKGTRSIAAWWPGANYVTWVGIDGYYVRRSDNFDSVFGGTISQVQALTHKPILLSESGVSPKIIRFAKIENLFNGLESHNLLGLVWFDEDQQANGPYHQDWSIEGRSQSDTQAQIAFRQGIAGLKIAHT